ncbi:histidine phosphatase family protein [Pseudomonas sp. LS44]|uniref:histidine phosphatase family protein n=1 Tax=Pseudomonas sp. LS44 TaxID=1357074 RepID=UPI00215AF4E5|nr:histidine phosphatase family protein [Pseudomonas sp. LS44]UVE19713.1 histidine phosphatase family protein [Pseudomonas sp. LS44]
MGSIYLIRHGQASFGADDYDVLSETGIRQAELLGKYLIQIGAQFDRAISGDLRRQQHTAEHAFAQYRAAGLDAPEIETDSAFNEFDADGVIRALLPSLVSGEPEALYVLRNGAQNRAEFQRLFALLIGRWINGEHESDLASWQSFVDAVEAGLDRILDTTTNKQNVAVFTSGGTITALLHLVTGIPVAKAFELNWQILNTSLNRLKFRGREVALASFNSHAHLESLKAPELITYR